MMLGLGGLSLGSIQVSGNVKLSFRFNTWFLRNSQVVSELLQCGKYLFLVHQFSFCYRLVGTNPGGRSSACLVLILRHVWSLIIFFTKNGK
jgi:hypothetical protein